MARGGRRTYVRDASGRFASTPGGGLGAARKAARSQSGKASTLQARTSLKRSRAKLAKQDLADQRLSASLSARAQKGAVTRGNKGLKTAKVAAKARISGGGKGVIGKPRGLKPGALAAKGKTVAPKRTIASKRVVTGDRIGRMVDRLAARRDQLIKGGSMFDTKAEQSKDTTRRAMAFVQRKAYDKSNSKQQNLELNRQHMRAIAAGRPQDSPLYKSVASAIAATPRRSTRNQRKKTKQEILWQADRIIGKTIKKMVATVGKGKGNPIRTQNNRQVQVERFLARKKLLGEYLRLTAPADPIYMRPAGPGINQPRPRNPRRKPKP